MQNPTGVPSLRTRMRKVRTPGLCGYNKGGQWVSNTSVILIKSQLFESLVLHQKHLLSRKVSDKVWFLSKFNINE